VMDSINLAILIVDSPTRGCDSEAPAMPSGAAGGG
jgi:ABC-type sugar transport system ATPase subunit